MMTTLATTGHAALDLREQNFWVQVHGLAGWFDAHFEASCEGTRSPTDLGHVNFGSGFHRIFVCGCRSKGPNT